MSKAALQKAVEESAARVSEWRTNLAKLNAQIANARSRLEKSVTHRKQFALDASLGNSTAMAHIAKARTEHAVADGDLKDLATAMDEGSMRLIEAECEAKAARSNLGKFQADILKRQRVDLAGQLDQAIAALAGLYQQYEKLGRAIVDMPDVFQQNIHGMMATSHESVLGARRVRAAVPKLLEQVFQNAAYDEQKKELLATTEARFWNLPVETTTKAA